MVHARLILLVTIVLGLGLLGASPRAHAQSRNPATDTFTVNPGRIGALPSDAFNINTSPFAKYANVD